MPDLDPFAEMGGHDLTPALMALLGCDWGPSLHTADDSAPCHRQAVQRVAIHGPGDQGVVQLCAQHRDRLYAETMPHAGGEA